MELTNEQVVILLKKLEYNFKKSSDGLVVRLMEAKEQGLGITLSDQDKAVVNKRFESRFKKSIKEEHVSFRNLFA